VPWTKRARTFFLVRTFIESSGNLDVFLARAFSFPRKMYVSFYESSQWYKNLYVCVCVCIAVSLYLYYLIDLVSYRAA